MDCGHASSRRLTRRRLLVGTPAVALVIAAPVALDARYASASPVASDGLDTDLNRISGKPAEGSAARLLIAEADIASLAKKMRARKFSESNVEASIAALAKAGIPVYEDATASDPLIRPEEPPSPLRLLQWQVRNLTLELSARNGVIGASLDALFPPAEGIPPVSYLLAGYVSTANTPGGELARALVGRKNWKRAPKIVFPSLVFSLFCSDLAREAAAAGDDNAKRAIHALEPVCSEVQQFIDQTIAAVFDALKFDEPADVPGQIATGIWNFVVDLGEGVVQGALDVLTAPVTAAIRAVAGALAMGTLVVSLLQSWTVRVDATPADTRFGIDNEVVQGQLVSSVDAGGLDNWPPEVLDCAGVAGVQLPSFNAAGSPLTWSFTESPVDLIQQPQLPEKLDNDGNATLTYITNTESAKVAEGKERAGILFVDAVVKRQDLKQVQEALLGLLLAELPSPVAEVVSSLLGAEIEELGQQLVDLQSGHGLASVSVTYHEEEGAPTETPAQCFVGTWQVTSLGGIAEDLVSPIALPGWVFAGVSDNLGSQSMTYMFGADGTFSLDARQTSVSGAFDTPDGRITAEIAFDGVINGAYEASDGKLRLKAASFDDFAITISVYLDGVMGSSFPVSSDGFMLITEYSYGCGDSSLTLSPSGYSDSPIILTQTSN